MGEQITPVAPVFMIRVSNDGNMTQFESNGRVFLTIYCDGRCEVAEPWEASAKAFWELVRELGPQYFPSRTPSSGSGLDAAA